VGETDKAPSLRTILQRFDWLEQAACKGDPDPRTFFPESKYGTDATSPRSLLPLLICWGCPVRRTCLEEAFKSWGLPSR
jgi:hypothetical protein